MNRYSACLVASLTFVLVGMFAYMFRYEPLPEINQVGEFVQVWDRWSQRVCIVHLGIKGVACSSSDIAKQAPSGNPSAVEELVPASLQDKVRALRSAGFSEQEISDWVKHQQSKQDK